MSARRLYRFRALTRAPSGSPAVDADVPSFPGPVRSASLDRAPTAASEEICHPLGATAAAVTPLVSSFAATLWQAVRCERLVAKLILPGQDVLANHSHKEYLDMTLIVAFFLLWWS